MTFDDIGTTRRQKKVRKRKSADVKELHFLNLSKKKEEQDAICRWLYTGIMY